MQTIVAIIFPPNAGRVIIRFPSSDISRAVQSAVRPVVSLAGEEKKGASFSNKNSEARSHLDFFALASDKAGRHMEPFLIDIKPAASNDYMLSSHEGEEFIYVLEGSIEINYGRDVYVLNPGDSIYYDSIVSHNVHAYSNQTARILAVVYAPS